MTEASPGASVRDHAPEISVEKAAGVGAPGAEEVPAHEEVLVLDFGGQYSQLIARRIRECGVFAELLPSTVAVAEIEQRRPRGLVLSGGPASVYEPDAPRFPTELLDLGIPLLGICYGMQAMVAALGGRVEAADAGRVRPHRADRARRRRRAARGPAGRAALLDEPPRLGLRASRGVHGARLQPGLPGGGLRGARSEGSTGSSSIPRSSTPPTGRRSSPASCATWPGARSSGRRESVISEQVAAVRAQVGEGRVICGLSGGVDSSVAALLVHRAVGERLTCVFVDHGLMRQNEAEQVVEAFSEFGIPLVHVEAEERFLSRLAGVDDPEQKRKIIGEEFIRVFEEEAGKLDDVGYLVQGTLYSDVIESGGGTGADTIKSHHNVGGLPEEFDFELVEPLRMLFKDEVRAVGAELGLPDRMVWRQPFPGPGLAIRIVGGEVNRERLAVLRAADAILQEEVRAAGLYRELWQSFCVLPVVRSVGVQGDGRTYAYPIVIRAVTSDDAMTADWARLPYDLLERVSGRIINEIAEVNRVTLDISSKPPATIEWE